MSLSHVALVGRHVALIPLELSHASALATAGARGGDTFYFTFVPDTLEAAQLYVREALAACALGRALPYATVRVSDGCVVGSTRFGNLEYWDYGHSPRPQRPGPD